VAVQAGKTSVCEFESRYDLRGADRVIVDGEGIVGTVVPPKEKAGTKTPITRLAIRFETKADALPGMRDVRLIHAARSIDAGQIVVVRDPIIVETLNNDTMKTAQKIPLPAAVCGALEKAEDVDFFEFEVKAGTALTFT